MDFADESYVRCYTRKTLTWKQLGVEGRVVLRMMLGEFDAAGIFEIRGDAAECVAAITELELGLVRIGLERLVYTETWIVSPRSITWPTYEEGQNCRRSDRARQRDSRQSRAAKSVTDCHTPSRPVTRVTDCHPPSAPPLPLLPVHPDPERAPAASPKPGLRTITTPAGVVRVVSMPLGGPPREYLDEGVIRGIPLEQSISTWSHYFGAGLPTDGVERLHDWLLQRAKERWNRQQKTPAGKGERKGGSVGPVTQTFEEAMEGFK